MTTNIEVGQWVFYTYQTSEERGRDQYGFRNYVQKAKRHYCKVVAIEGDRATLESWEMARITRRTKAFGHRIDHTPFRVGGIFYMPVSELTPVVGGLARQLQQKLDAIMRYPTRGQRDYARAKRRKEAMK